jgi:hypothetical protein
MTLRESGIVDELYCDEFGTYWLRAEGRTRNQARMEIAKVDGCDYIATSARKVRGVEEDHEGGRWFTVTGQGTEFWEVTTA